MQAAVIGRFIGRYLQIFSVLQYRNFRLFWFGLLLQVSGQSMMFFTFGWLAYDLTGSELALGGVGLAMSIPRIILNLVGGFVADRFDQRHVITVVQSSSALIMVGLAWLTITGAVQIWHLYMAALLLSTVQAFDEPSRQSLFPHLLPNRSLLTSAVPMNSVVWEVGRVLAPAVAGFVIAYSGAGVSFFLSAAGFSVMAAVMRLLQVNRIPRAKGGSMLGNLTEGARYSWTEPVFRVIISTVFFNAIFGMGYMLLLPVFAADILQVDARGLGFLASSAGVGALVGVIIAPRLMTQVAVSRVIFRCVAGFGTALAAFSFSPWYPLSIACLVVVGFCFMTYMTASQVTLQHLVPDELRGRVMGLWSITWSLQSVGAAIVAAVASLIGVSLALGGSAILVVAFGLLVTGRSAAFRGLGVISTARPHTPPPGRPAAAGEAPSTP